MKIMRKVLSLLLVLAMVLSMAPAALAEDMILIAPRPGNRFTDVNEDHWFYAAVQNACELGLMTGCGNGIFDPEGEITLAQTVTIASRIHSIHHTGGESFEQGEPWYQVYVDYALENGILDAQPEDCGKPATRLEFAHILARALPAEALSAINTVDDGAIPDVAADEAVYLLYRAGVLTGADAKGTFLPAETIVRSEVAAIAARMADPTLRLPVTLKVEKPEFDFIVDPDPVVPDPILPEAEEDEPAEEENTPAEEEEGVLDENNALSVPFDQAYPDLFASGEIDYSGEQLLIKLAGEPTGEEQQELSEAGVVRLELLMEGLDGSWYKAVISGDVNEAMDAVRALPFVLLAEYDYAYEAESIIECTPGELDEVVHGNSYMDRQWYLCSCGIKDGWHHTKHPHHRPGFDEDGDKGDGEDGSGQSQGVEAGEGIVVAVIDTGVDFDHEDLAGNMWVNTGEIPNNGVDDDGNGYIDDYYGVNVITGEGNGDDDQGHGIHVAGIIAAANNDVGIVGIAYNAKIMAIKAGMASGYFNQSDILKAIVYAYENGADVINMSFGGSAATIAVQDALAKAYTRCVLVASAGNDAMPNEITDSYPIPMPSYPAALSYVIGVMSVGSGGVESSFTNWDAYPFNSVEYEVCAPGEEMISTIPGDGYATWSGTSMAAPVVSAIAALVRSEYRDPGTYPTKFIYGQLCGTGDTAGICRDPEKHTVNGETHTLPNVVDVYNALTVLPNPDVGVEDDTYFDVSTTGDNTSAVGDGIIDAGETIELGFTLRNRWGKSKNTTVTVDALSDAGIPDPYVTIHNPTVDYGSVGTYSTQDAGKVMTGDMWTGWENPIRLTIASDCPNDYIIQLNVTVKCENGLDGGDTAVYTSGTTLLLKVRNGYILPAIFEEDTVLTSDNYYIISNAAYVPEGVTVTVEPGTQIQFWTDDPNDSYAESAITKLTVAGTFLCRGTAEERVKLFPSQLMSRFRVEISATDTGLVELYYTDVVNPELYGIAYAEGCEFTQNYRRDLIAFRYLQDGKVWESQWSGIIRLGRAKECAFYGLGAASAEYAYNCEGMYENCVFADSVICCETYYTPGSAFENCLFYGNNNSRGDEPGGASAIEIPDPGDIQTNDVCTVCTDPATGTVYVAVGYWQQGQIDRVKQVAWMEGFAAHLGGYLTCIETEAEMEYLTGQFKRYGYNYLVGLEYDFAGERFVWQNGVPVGEHLPCSRVGYEIFGVCNFEGRRGYFGSGYIEEYRHILYALIEIPNGPADLTEEKLMEEWADYVECGVNGVFRGNAVINRLNDDRVELWMRPQGADSSTYQRVSLAGNYWGTTTEFLVEKQVVDFNDYQTLLDLDPAGWLTEAPENVWPFVVKAGLEDEEGEEVTVIGNETVTFFVEFNRDMDTSIPLDVCFGSAYPYADYEVDGGWVSPRRWEGTTTLTTLIEGGYHCWSIDNGKAAGTNMKLYRDWGRFPFEIDTTEAMAMTLQGYATENGIQLTWSQDDFDTLMGYNIYRADEDEDAYYQRLNSSIIPVGSEEFFDSTVEPGRDYYYIFTVVKTDLTESEPSGKIKLQSMDTMAPVMYHTPVYEAYVGNNVVISANVTDNLRLTDVTLWYKAGSGSWKSVAMQNLNDRWSALISGNNVTLEGVSYYITASDGVSTVSLGSENDPYVITVKEPPTSLMEGDVNGDGVIGIADALLVLRARNNKVVLTSEQFARADIDDDGILSAAEALKILRYANGEINSLD